MTIRASGDASPARMGRAIVGGVVGAVVMAMWAMIMAAVSGMGFWRPVQLIAAAWLGPSAVMHATGGVIVTGLMTHMMMGAVLGSLLAVMLRVLHIKAGSSRLVWGMIYGLVVWVVNQFVILPSVDPLLASHMTPWAFALGHVMFGLVTAGFVLGTPRAVGR